MLRDGSVAHVRPITPEDAERLRRFHAGQSQESIYLRFFAPLRELSDRDVRRFTEVDHVDRVALVATVGGDIIGVARYDRLQPGGATAEVAFNVSDAHHGRGVGSVLLEHLAAIGQEEGITSFVAEVLPQNAKMLAVFADAGYDVERHYEDGVVEVSFGIEPTEQSEAVRRAREHRAEYVSIRAALFPRTVAVVGASRRSEAAGQRVLRNILDYGFTGDVYPVNPEATLVLGHPAYPRVSDVPAQVDLAVLAVPAEAVLDVVDDCASAGVRSLLVVSTGFAEQGREGAERQAELLRRARSHGMRVIGPASVGVINSSAEVRLNATLAAATLPPPGGFGLFAQSAALGIAVLAWAAGRDIGVSVFAATGNRVDVSGNDLMQFWIDDDETVAVGMYLETMGNPRKFSRIARALASRKPVIVVSPGLVSHRGHAPGHRVRPTSVPPEAFDAMLQQAGVIRVEDVRQLFDVAQLVVHQPLPRGRRVAVVGNSAALNAITAEACAGWGLHVSHGPVSLPAEASGAELVDAVVRAFDDPEVDSVIACSIPLLFTPDPEVAGELARVATGRDKPLVAALLGMRDIGRSLAGEAPEGQQRRRVVPSYPMPLEAVRALAHVTHYGQWQTRDRGALVTPHGTDRERARATVARVLAAAPEGRPLTAEETAEVLAAYGIGYWPTMRVSSAEEAVAAAATLGYPVVVKSVAASVRHQVGFGGVRVDLKTPLAVREAFDTLNERLGGRDASELVVQSMAPTGVACVVSGAEDNLFGPVVSFGVGGPPTDLLGDIGHRIPPLTDVDVSDLISSVRAAPLLDGHRGATPVDRAALGDLIARVSVLTDDLDDVAWLELNPVMAHPRGAEVLGAEMSVAPAVARADSLRRALL